MSGGLRSARHRAARTVAGLTVDVVGGPPFTPGPPPPEGWTLDTVAEACDAYAAAHGGGRALALRAFSALSDALTPEDVAEAPSLSGRSRNLKSHRLRLRFLGLDGDPFECAAERAWRHGADPDDGPGAPPF